MGISRPAMFSVSSIPAKNCASSRLSVFAHTRQKDDRVSSATASRNVSAQWPRCWDQNRRKMASSYFSRMLMLALVLAAGLIISWFDPISVVFPLFFVKISLTVGYIFLGKGGNKN